MPSSSIPCTNVLGLALGAVALAACGASPAPEPGLAGHGEHHGAPHHEHDHEHAHLHRFEDPAFWSQRWDDPARDAWQRPHEIVGLLTLAPGMTVADLGTGTGYFVPYLSRAVGPGGRVLALDVEPAMVRWVTERADKDGLANVEARAVAPDEPGLAPASVDRVLVANTWHHVAGRVAYAQKLAAALRPGGEVWIVDFTKESPKGPPPEAKLGEAEVMAELRAAGLTPGVATEGLVDQYAVFGRR